MQNNLKILMFHRILPKTIISEPNAYGDRGTLISLDFFKNILSVVKENDFEVLLLNQLIERINTNTLTGNELVFTFDDGYKDNFTYAWPELEGQRYRGTFFPILNNCLFQKNSMLDEYYHSIDNIELGKGERANFITGDCKKQFIYGNGECKMAMIKSLQQLQNSTIYLEKCLYMTKGNLRELAKKGNEIGGHTMSHPILPQTIDDDAIKEVKNNFEILTEINFDQRISFAYPDGKYDQRTLEIVKKAGFCGAATTETALTCYSLFELPRIFVTPNFDLKRLTKKI